jgi:hypothetical protein
MDLPINGKTISWVREQLSEVFQIPPEATAFVDGKRVPEDFVLTQGQILEFTDERKAGARKDDLSDSPESY